MPKPNKRANELALKARKENEIVIQKVKDTIDLQKKKIAKMNVVLSKSSGYHITQEQKDLLVDFLQETGEIIEYVYMNFNTSLEKISRIIDLKKEFYEQTLGDKAINLKVDSSLVHNIIVNVDNSMKILEAMLSLLEGKKWREIKKQQSQ